MPSKTIHSTTHLLMYRLWNDIGIQLFVKSFTNRLNDIHIRQKHTKAEFASVTPTHHSNRQQHQEYSAESNHSSVKPIQKHFKRESGTAAISDNLNNKNILESTVDRSDVQQNWLKFGLKGKKNSSKYDQISGNLCMHICLYDLGEQTYVNQLNEPVKEVKRENH